MMPEPTDPTLRVYQPARCRDCGWRWPFSENKPPPPGAVCLNCDGELERDHGVTASSDEPTDPTLQVYQRPAADVAHRPGSGRVTPDGVTEADVFAGCAAVALPAQRRCPGDRHYPGPRRGSSSYRDPVHVPVLPGRVRDRRRRHPRPSGGAAVTWFGVFLVIYWVVNAFGYVALIGKSWRVTPEMALGMIIVYGLLIWGAVTVGTVHP